MSRPALRDQRPCSNYQACRAGGTDRGARCRQRDGTDRCAQRAELAEDLRTIDAQPEGEPASAEAPIVASRASKTEADRELSILTCSNCSTRLQDGSAA
jgi:hypothetical protein